MRIIPKACQNGQILNHASFKCRIGDEVTIVDIDGFDEFEDLTTQEIKKQNWLYGSMECLIRLVVFLTAPERRSSGNAITAVGYGPNYFILRISFGPQ